MKIGVTSQNKLKVDAVKEVFSSVYTNSEVIGYKTDSKVGEQPVDEETILGARNRVLDLASRVTGLDLIVSIESGIFFSGENWVDKAVILAYFPSTKKEIIEFSSSVVFPTEYVDKARTIGFNKTTVGKVMKDSGYILDDKDPHFSLTGISRKDYIVSGLKRLIKKIN